MTVAMIMTVMAGLLSAIGLGGVLIGAARPGREGSKRIFLIGSMSLTLAGLVMLVSGMIGVGGTSELFGGLMLIIFGTSITLPAHRAAGKRGGAGRT